MPSSSDNRSEPGRRRRDSFDGLRDLQRSTTDGDGSSRDRRRRPPPPTVRGVHSGADVAGPGLAGLANLEVGRRRRWPRRTLVLVNSFVALCLIAAVGAYAYIHHQLGNVTRVTASALSAQRSGPFTVLIIGSDSRDLSGAGNAQFGTASETPGQRSDTVMLARVVPKTHSLTLLSIPRDLYVPIAGMGDSRINSAFNTGPNLLISTIHTDLGIPINHFVEINFDTFEGITDAVGGVKVWFPTPARDAYSLLSVPTAGCVNLTGAQALGFARSRHYQYEVDGQWMTQGLSDLARIQRQQFFVKKMIAKAEGKLTNPLALNDIIDSVTKNLTVDSHFQTGLMISLAEDFHKADVAGIPTETLPVYNEVIDGADVLGLQQPQARQMIAAFNALGTAPATARTTAVTVRAGGGRTLVSARRSLGAASSRVVTGPVPSRVVTAADVSRAAPVPAASAGSTPVDNYVLPGPAPTEAELAGC